MICHICANQEFRDNLRSETKKDPAFFSKGYSNWKKAIEKFEGHQKFSWLKTAVSFEVVVRQCRDVQVMHVTQILKELELDGRYFHMILETTKTLARQEVSFQGHSNNDNFTQFLSLRPKDDPDIWRSLLDLPGSSKKKKFSHDQYQNEIIDLMAHDVATTWKTQMYPKQHVLWDYGRWVYWHSKSRTSIFFIFEMDCTNLPTNCLSAFDHFVKLVLKGLSVLVKHTTVLLTWLG